MYDITIIGAGPAGSTLARLLGVRYKVLLVDKRSLDEAPDHAVSKCCGGLLAPDAQAMLSKMGLGLPVEVLVDPQIFAVRTLDLNQGLERYYQRHYINMDRESFDRWLVSLLTQDVVRMFGFRFQTLTRVEGGWEVTLAGRDGPEKVLSCIVVGADGALSAVRRTAFGAPSVPIVYTSIQERIETPLSFPYFTAVFDREITDYYSWVIPKGDHILVGAALRPRFETSGRFELLKEKLSQRGFQLGRTVMRQGAAIFRPTATRHLITGKEGVALVGEAAGWISPSSAEGISYAFKSALGLAEALLEGRDGFEERYRRKTARLRKNVFLKNLKSPFMYTPLLRKLIMASGVGSMKVRGK